ncbi:glycosyltransferase family 2 protein [Erwinia persicina]|uniref:glycosyltransferase family 2 protein n=1 Tax=Erwinia persicina TaxID=55211 RepID=UPI000788F44B|nr:glycosyltransferase family 2 protein [Erwinia persicina]
MEKISIIIPVYNSSQYLKDALDSVVQQELSNYEIIIIDDGSTEEEHNKYQLIIDSFNETLLFTKKNGGAASARNLGAQKATGNILAFLDSDDIWLPGKLASQLKIMNEEKADLVLGNILVANHNLNVKYKAKKTLPAEFKKCMEDFFYGKILMNTPTIIVRKSFFERMNGFCELLKYREDHYFLINSAAEGKIALDDKFLTIRRERENSLSMVSDINAEVSKHAKFWELISNKYGFLNIRKAKIILFIRLYVYYIRNNRTRDLSGTLKYIKLESTVLYFILKPAQYFGLPVKILFNLRGALRRAFK